MAQGGGFQRRGMLSKRRETNPWKVFQSQLPHVQVSLPPLMDQCAPSVFAASNFLFSPPQNNEGHMIMKKGPRKKANQTRQSLPEGYKFAGFDSAQKFPNAKERLHNILQGAAKEHKLNFVSEQVQSGFWKAELQINWPHAMCFCGEGWEKREAEKRAAALACDELEKCGFSRGAANILREQEIEKEDEPKWINMSADKLSRIESFLYKHSVVFGKNSAYQGYVFERGNSSTAQSCQQNQSADGNQPPFHCWQYSTPQIPSTLSARSAQSNDMFILSHSQMDKNNATQTDMSIVPSGFNEGYGQDHHKQHKQFVCQDNPFSHFTSLKSEGIPNPSNTKPWLLNNSNTAINTPFNPVDTSNEVRDIFGGCLWKSLPEEEQKKWNAQLLEEFCHKQETCDARHLKIKGETSKLPVASVRNEIIDLILKNKVVVISGQTGCGKTTQIPQYILDHEIQSGRGSTCNIVVTQPRRIAAMSIVERVAHERGEQLGKSVGYQVRLEGIPPTQWGRILFCTTGILLRCMQNNALLQGVSHIIVDEVHERDINTDFLLILLKGLLDMNTSIKIIVMSATLNADRFSQYFYGCPIRTIPGFTHPVTELFLSDVEDMLSGVLPKPDQDQNKRIRLMRHSAKFQEDNKETHPEADTELMSDTILHVCRNYPEGAVICFLAGWDEITMVNDSLMTKIKDKSQFLVLPLHSMLPTFHRHAVFNRPPVGVRKIVLATNIAETSLTIDDVVYVINAGNLKEKVYDAQRKVCCLMTRWISQASAVQRGGRAGRCKPGFCFNLFTREQFKKMAPYPIPEIMRISLEEIVLQTKIHCLGGCFSAQQFLAKALDPPSPFAVRNAVSVLQDIGALDGQEHLTALGRHMAHLPVEPRIAKMIIYGAIFRCLDPVLTIAASLGYKDPFVAPFDKREQADVARRRFAQGSRSDHVAVLNAFNGWQAAVDQSQGKEYADQNFLHLGTLNMIRGMRNQFYRLLEDSRLLPPVNRGELTCTFSGNLELTKAIICAGLFPNLVKIGLGLESKGRSGKKRMRICLRTKTDGRVFLHPSSVNCDEKQYSSRWLVYQEKVKSTQVFIRDCTLVHPLALICFAGKTIDEISDSGSNPSRVTFAVDGDRWIGFYCSPRLARALLALRGEIQKMISCNVSAVSENHAWFNYNTELIQTVCFLLDAPTQQSCLASEFRFV